MIVLKIVFSIVSLGTGGAERVATVLANKLVENGHEVAIVYFYKFDDFNYFIHPKVQLIDFANKEKSGFQALHFVSVFKRIVRVRDFIKKFKADVMISFYVNNSCQNIISTIGTNVPVIISERDAFITCDGKIKRMLRTLFYPLANGFIYQTQQAKEVLNQYNLRKSPSIILANPVHIDIFNDEVEVGTSKKIVCAGRLDKNKNFAGIIFAFFKIADKHPDFTLEIYGDGPERDNLSQLISECRLQGKVKLVGVTKDIVKAFTGATMFVLFSHTEGYPNVLLEAMAVGLPVIASDCPIGGPASLIKNGENGLLVKPGDIDGLALKMDSLLSDAETCKKLAMNARRVRLDNSISEIYNSLEQFIALL